MLEGAADDGGCGVKQDQESTMNEESYDQWLKDLKPEDTVIVEELYIHTSLSVSKVVRITPKGGIRVTGYESVLFKKGYVHRGYGYGSYRLLEPTEERIDRIRLVRLRRELKSTDWNLISDDVVKNVWELM